MSVNLGDDVTYPMRGVGSISFQVPSGDVLELNDVLVFTGLNNYLLLISCMTNI
jgi:hypothetical protein